MARRLTLEIDGAALELALQRGPGGGLRVEIDGEAHQVELESRGAGGLHRLRVDGRSTDLHIARANSCDDARRVYGGPTWVHGGPPG